ncbi:MAG: hypothetical protein Q8R37_03840 [Nanoarchaeota archaeon]|nr:hypothetical protein [Nanoarchaeota archaeon]
MPIPYDLIRHFEGKKPLLERDSRSVEEQTDYLLQSGKMAGIPLGACLDSCRWGSKTTTVYEMSVQGIVSFIQNWMAQNPDNYQQLFHERPLEEIYTKLELPRIKHEKCPRDEKHQGTVTDFEEKKRCTFRKKRHFRPSFMESYKEFDELAQLERKHYYERDFTTSREKRIYLQEKDQMTEITDHCYAILSDKDVILSLETVLRRLNLYPETNVKVFKDTPPKPTNKYQFAGDGWDVAAYTQKWYEQLPGAELPPFREEQ